MEIEIEMEKFNLIFSSEKITPENEAAVQQKISIILKTNKTEIKKLFNGKKNRFLKNINYKLAKSLSTQISQTGAVCIVERCTTKKPIIKQQNPEQSNATQPSLSLADTEKPITISSFYCPKCKLQQPQQNTCVHCQYNLLNYRNQMKNKGLYEVKGKGYVQNQRKIHRRENQQRREMIRLENCMNRRKISDRRLESQEWRNVWS